MEFLTREEQIELMAFINMMIKQTESENIINDINKIYAKLEKNINRHIMTIENIDEIRYSYSTETKNPINYFLENKNLVTILKYKEAIEIAYAVIDSLGGKYDYLDELTSKYEEE